MKTNIIQWNINGFFSRLEELQILTKELNPAIICIQETNFNEKSNPNFTHYDIYKRNRFSCIRASGGVAIMINKDFPSVELPLITDFEAIAVSVNLPHTKLTICNIYIPNNRDFCLEDIERIIKQLPNSFIIVGDFNSHSETWGSYKSDRRGKIIDELLNNENLMLLNNGQPTRINPINELSSAIDLSIANTSLAHKLEWCTLPYTINSSDHIPIQISINHPLDDTHLVYPSRWSIRKANWDLFSSLIEKKTESLPTPSPENIDADVKEFTDIITEAALITIGKSKSSSPRPRVPWWNEEIKKAIQNKNKALKKFQISRSQVDFISLKRTRALTRYLVKSSKSLSWKLYVSSIDNQTDSSIVWKKIKSIRGTNRNNIHFLTDSNITTSPKEVANTLGQMFQENSSKSIYDQEFLSKANIYNNPSNTVDPHNNVQTYLNSPLLITELEEALRNCKSKSPGPDGIPYLFVQNLPANARTHLISIYNSIWNNNCFPNTWRHGLVIPILKPDKNKFLPDSYRPICLLNTLCKLLEKMINNRLMWHLEKSNYLTPEQNGFRRDRSTTKNILNIKNEIQTALKYKQSLGLISFDIAKAYDSAWRPRIIHKLNKILTKGNMLDFINNFLGTRTFQVKTSNTLSDIFTQENGVPQGSTISVTLFLIAINDISEGIRNPNIPLLYADDFNILCRSSNSNTIQQMLQDSTNKLESWSKTAGFRFASNKTSLILINQKRKKENIAIKMGNHTIKNQTQVKILGVILDSKASWRPYIQHIRKSCLSGINLIKTLSHTAWGAQTQMLLKIHKTLILSKIDYGASLISAAKPSHLRTLESIHNAGIRLSIGAFRSSPISSILSIAGIPPLDIRWSELTSKTAARMARSPQGLHSSPNHIFNNYKKYDLDNIMTTEISISPPWLISMNIILDLHQLPKKYTSSTQYRNLFMEILSSKQQHALIYTDASVAVNRVGMAIIHGDTHIQWKLSNKCSIYTAEALAILKAIEFATNKVEAKQIIILSDSLSSLMSIQNQWKPTDLARKIHNAHSTATFAGKQISFMWIPGHCNIRGNELADKAAKQAHLANNPLTSLVFTYQDVKRIIAKEAHNQWENKWAAETTKLQEIKRTTYPWPFPANISRKQETAITRLRIGHTHITHQHLMKGEEPPICTQCGSLLTVKHILTECRRYENERRELNLPDQLAESLSPEQSNLTTTLVFLHNTGLLNKI